MAEPGQVKLEQVRALLFDVFGTVVDWRSSIVADMQAFAGQRGIAGDWTQFADDWRGLYQPSMEAVRSGRRPWTILDELHRESLDVLLPRYGLSDLPAADLDHINRVWHRLQPWPDAVPGLVRLKSRFIIGPLSNGNVGLLVRMAKHDGLPWDVILSAETARAYKPMPASYTESARLLNLTPGEVMLVAAHNGDLAAAKAAGLATGFVARPTEHGPGQIKDLAPTGAWDVVAASFIALADQLGC